MTTMNNGTKYCSDCGLGRHPEAKKPCPRCTGPDDMRGPRYTTKTRPGELQTRILDILDRHGKSSAERVIRLYRKEFGEPNEQSIRVRLSTLARDGVYVEKFEDPTKYGHVYSVSSWNVVYAITPDGVVWLCNQPRS